jgi:hypothetical protein
VSNNAMKTAKNGEEDKVIKLTSTSIVVATAWAAPWMSGCERFACELQSSSLLDGAPDLLAPTPSAWKLTTSVHPCSTGSSGGGSMQQPRWGGGEVRDAAYGTGAEGRGVEGTRLHCC